MTLDDLITTARERGLREMRVHLVGATDPQWQVSSRFVGSSGYHVYIEADLAYALLRALNPPTGAAPVAPPASAQTVGMTEYGDPTAEDIAVAEMIEAVDPVKKAEHEAQVWREQQSIGLFD